MSDQQPDATVPVDQITSITGAAPPIQDTPLLPATGASEQAAPADPPLPKPGLDDEFEAGIDRLGYSLHTVTRVRGLTVKAFATKVGEDPAYVARVFTGQELDVPLRKYAKWACVLGFRFAADVYDPGAPAPKE